jgi:hypothetical protein
MLRLRQLRPSPLATFVLFEGSIMVALLLALAEIVDWWGVLAIPVAVAVMVKLNDAITAVLRRPAALAQLDRPRLAGGPAIGVSPRTTTAHITTWIKDDDAVGDPAAYPHPRVTPAPRPDRDGVARGIAAVSNPGNDESGPVPKARPDDAEHRRRDRGNQGHFFS